jgi:peroxidase
MLALPRITDFTQISSDLHVNQRLAQAYTDVDEIDLWIGGLAEDPAETGMVGPTFAAILVSQFAALRDGDRFWYQRVFGGSELRELENTRLSDIIRRNTRINRELPDNVFLVSQ